MASISSTGIGSGLDVTNIVSQLVALEKQPLKNLQLKATTVNAQISAMGDIKSQFSAMTDVASRISSSGAWAARTASSSNASAASISVTSAAAATTFTLDVDALAQKQSVSSAAITADSAVGQGTMTFRLGTWSGPTGDATLDNANAAAAAAALPGAQAALATAQANLATANSSLTSANTTLSTADATLASATTDASAANAALLSATNAYNGSVTAFNAADATRVAAESTLVTANSTSASAAAAAAAGQTALNNATAAAPAAIATAQANYDAADLVFTNATTTSASALADSTAADLAWTNATTTANTANASLGSANTSLTNANAGLATANSNFSAANAQLGLLSAADSASTAASTALQDDQTASTDLAGFASGYGGAGAAQLSTYAQKYTDWVASIAANDHVTPSGQTDENTARAAMLSARSTLAIADPTALASADAITAVADSTNSSLLKGQAINAATGAGTTPALAASAKAAALVGQTAAATAVASATATYNSALAAQSAAAAAASAANASLGTAASDKTAKAAALAAANTALANASADRSAKASLLAAASGAVAAATLTRDTTATTAATAATAAASALTDRDAAVTAANAASAAMGTANADKTAAQADATSKAATLATATSDRATAFAAVGAATTAVSNATAAVNSATTAVTNATNGSAAVPTFTPAAGSADVNVSVSATDTVSTLAAKINAANAGVVAAAFFDGTSDRLQLVSKDTGANAGFRVQVSDTGDGNNTDNAGLSRMAYDPQTGAFGMASSGIAAKYGSDARVRINGLAVTSKSNTLTDNLPGVTIDLKATTTTGYGTVSEVKSPVTMNVSEDVTLAVKNINEFVTAYNALNKNLTELTKYDATTKTASLFQADSSILGLQSVLRNMLGSVSTGSTYRRLADVGVERQLDGSLTMNTGKLSSAANNGTELQKLFTLDTGDNQTSGFALKIARLGSGLLSSGGAVTNKQHALQNVLDRNEKDQTKVNDRAAATEARLRKTYTALDAKMAGLNALSTYVSQQVTTWNKSSN